MYDDIATLKSYGAPTYDSYGNAVRVAQERDVFVQPRSVYASEFYQAAQNGLKPSITLYLTNREDYQGEKSLTYQGKDYTVIRVDWKAQRDGISLVCEERVNDAG